MSEEKESGKCGQINCISSTVISRFFFIQVAGNLPFSHFYSIDAFALNILNLFRFFFPGMEAFWASTLLYAKSFGNMVELVFSSD